MFPIRLTAIAGLAAAAILFVNAAKRAGLIEISAATQLVAPLAQALALILAVDLALVVDVLPNPDTAAKDLGVFNIAGALPFSIAPALAPT
ncbi:MAG: MFS transporter, partial [Actinomycetota bacterium]|nr:MFS transporter [Actinomycetota bacterium]